MQRLRSQSAESAPPRPASEARPAVSDVHLRNYDFDRGYDLRVVIFRGEETCVRETYHAGPGWSRSVHLDLPPDTYEVLVTLDGEKTRRSECALGPAPEDSLLVEFGNGSLALTQGLY